MFVIKYDKLSMVKLVQSVEKYPAIYNNKKHYSKDDQDRAWDRVALEVGEKDSLCRDRWHSIKSCYIRHLKYSALNSKRRPYYLADYLGFLLPYVSDRLKNFIKFQTTHTGALPAYLKDVLPPSESGNEHLPTNVLNIVDSETVIKTEIVDIEDISESDWGSIGSDQPSTSKDAYKSPEIEKNVRKKRRTECTNIKTDPDASFFKGILPDIGRMSNHQKLKFKQEALSIIEDILYATEEINVTE